MKPYFFIRVPTNNRVDCPPRLTVFDGYYLHGDVYNSTFMTFWRFVKNSRGLNNNRRSVCTWIIHFTSVRINFSCTTFNIFDVFSKNFYMHCSSFSKTKHSWTWLWRLACTWAIHCTKNKNRFPRYKTHSFKSFKSKTINTRRLHYEVKRFIIWWGMYTSTNDEVVDLFLHTPFRVQDNHLGFGVTNLLFALSIKCIRLFVVNDRREQRDERSPSSVNRPTTASGGETCVDRRDV